MTQKQIIDILGLECFDLKVNKTHYKALFNEFNKLAQKYEPNKIWLKGDYGIYCKGKIIDETDKLIVVNDN